MHNKISRRAMVGAGASAAMASMLGSPGRLLAQEAKRLPIQLNWLETGDFSPLFAAELKRYDREAGLQFAFEPGGPQVDAIQVVAGGSAPVGLIANMHQIVGARSAGLPVRAFAITYQTTPTGVISKAEKPIRTAKDLIGKKIGLQAGARAAFALMIAAANISPDSLTIVPVGVDPTPLIAGQIDGYWGTAVNQVITLNLQGVQTAMLTSSAAGLPSYWQVYFATDKVINEQSDMLVRMVQAAVRGSQYFKENPDEVAAHIVARSPKLNLNPEQVKLQCRALTALVEAPITKQKGMGWFDPADFATTIDLMVKLDQIPARINPADTYTMAILERAFGGKTVL